MSAAEEMMHNGNLDEWLRNGLAGKHGCFSLQELETPEIEKLTVSAIHEHRRRLERAQFLHEKIESLSQDVPDELKNEYEQALRDNDTQQMVLQMLVDILGYVPKLEKKGRKSRIST